jgi:hypothetical protein
MPPFQATTDTIKNSTRELRNITTQYTANDEADQLHPAPCNSREASSDGIVQDAGEGAKGGKNRHKQRLQEAPTVAGDDIDNDKQAGSSGMAFTVAAVGMMKNFMPTYHFEKLHEETCPTHAYPVKHKLRDYDMMKNFMASGSLARGMEVNEVPDEGNTTPFAGEDTVMMIYNGAPHRGCTA